MANGSPGPDSFTATSGDERIDAGAGHDTVTFSFNLTDATFSFVGDEVIVDTAISHTILTGVEEYHFNDGVVNNDDSDPLVNDLFYYSQYRDIWDAHADADAHYRSSGVQEGRSPNETFTPAEYLASNPDLIQAFGFDIVAAGEHYITNGYSEGRATNSFNALEYLASNDDLIQAFGLNPGAAEQHFVTNGFNEHRATNSFDATEYLASNSDLIQAFGLNTIAAEQHYVTIGFNEHRATHSFDALEYLASNADLIAAFGLNTAAAEQHYVANGFGEGRATHSFDALEYLASNSDLIQAFGLNTAAAEQHYVTTGFNEGRATNSFDALEYIASNSDLIAAFGLNTAAAEQHYVTTGFNEGRATNSFDALEYIASNSDLIAAFGLDTTAAEQHYITTGISEGRATSSFNAAQYLANYADLSAAFGNDLAAAERHYITTGIHEGRTDQAPVGNAVISDPPSQDVTEDAATTLSVSGQLTVTDPDPEQSVFRTSSVSAAGNLGQLSISADGHYTYSIDNAAVQYLAAGESRVETFTVSSIDNTQKEISFTTHGAQDAPVLTADDAFGTDDTSTPLSISAQWIDDNGGPRVVSIDGIPTSYTLNHGTVFDDGHWEVSKSDLPGLALVPVLGQANAGILLLHLSAASVEGGNSAMAAADIAVTLGTGADEITARVVDGYIAGATVFADANGNGVLDVGEASAITNADGSFTLHGGSGNLVMTGGTDVSTGVAFTGMLSAPEGSTVVTPLTTLISSLAVNGVTAADAAAQVASAFGLTGVDITTFDPVPHAVAGDPTATAVLAAGVQVQSTVAQISAVGASSAAVFDAIAGAITNAGAGQVNLSTGSTVALIVSDSHVTDATVAAAVTSVVSAANNSIQMAPDVTAIAQAGQVAQGAAVAQLAATDFTDQAAIDHLHDVYVTDLSNQVSQAQVGAVGGAILGTSGNDNLTGTSAIDSIDGLEGNDRISGGDGADLLFGGAGNDRLTGNAGNDRLDGGIGFDRAVYSDATGSVTINLAAGTASGAGVDNDTLTNIEGIVGSNAADTYNAIGFTGDSATPGTPIGFNEFEGSGGDDIVYGTVNALGAALTRVSYVSATSGVTVDIAAGAAEGDGSVGHDTFVGAGVFSVFGSSHDDTLYGSNNGFGTVEVFAGFAGNDTINGRGGFDRVDYNQDATTTSGITVHLAAGTVTGDASVGSDTLVSVEAVRGTNFADTYDATGFTGTSVNAGSLGTFNEFTGNGGNDVIIGNGFTRISFNNATAGVTVDLQTGTTPGTGTATGDASVGTDTFSGVNAVQASMFSDTIYGSNNTAATETFTGLGGNDYIDGRGGFDIASYNNIYQSTGGITVSMAAGIVVGDASIGTDTLRSIEGIQGTGNADIYNSTGYGVAGALNVGNNGTFNQFEGLGGNDLITGNGNTRLIYVNAAAAVAVDLSAGNAHGIAAGDIAAIGTDTITGGVNSVTGSAFNDTLTGDGNSNTFTGGGGNDTIDGGGAGDIAIFSGSRGQYTISTTAGVTTVTDNVAGRDGTDTLTNVEVLQFNNTNVLINPGNQANPVDLSDSRLFFSAATSPLTAATGLNSDYVKINQGLSGHLIDLGNGTDDTVILGITGGYNLNLANVEHLVGTGGDDFAGLISNVNGLSIDMGGGADNVNLANGSNSVSVTNVEMLGGSDFTGPASNDTLTLLNNVSGLSVNLGAGTNSLNLAAGANSFTGIGSVDAINGTASDDTLTVGSNGLYTPNSDLSIDLGAGNDTLIVGAQYDSFALQNVEQLVVNSQDAGYTLTNDQNGLSVDLGGGNTYLQIAAGVNALSLTNVQVVSTGDFNGVGGSAPSDDTLTLLNDVSGLSVNLGQGLNTLNLAAGTNSLTAYNLQAVNGTGLADSLTLLNSVFGATIDLSAGNDTLQLADGGNSVTVKNIEAVVGGNGGDNIVVANSTGTTIVTGGAGADFITVGAATDVIRYTDASESSGSSVDTITNFNAAQDSFQLAQVAGLAGSVHFVASGVLDGSAHAEAILVNSGGQSQLQIDVNGDGTIGAGDITIFMNGLTGTLSDANFSVGSNFVGDAGPNTLIGTAGDETLQGLGGNDRLQGLGGNDVIDGGQGFDRAIYTDATSGIAFNLASGSVTGAGVGTDTLIGIEGIVGTNFDDTFDASGYTGASGVPGTPIGFNEFEGLGGNDTITGYINAQGAAITRVSYVHATSAVTVDFAAKTADGDASVGHDTFTNYIANVIGSNFGDTLTGSNNPSGTVEVFDARGGDDTINGGGGFDRADYNQDLTTTSGITVNLAAGTVTGDSTVGTDTLRSVEGVRGTAFADTYNATGFNGTSTNAGSLGTFNEFTGGGGDDIITGNGATRLSFNNATAGVTVDMQTGATPGTGTASGNASVGNDSFSGVNAIQASMFDDTLRGSNITTTTETFAGLGGNDFIDGRGGFDLATYNNIYFSTGPVTVNMGAGTAAGDASIGTDTLRSIEAIQGTNFNDSYDASTFGTAGALNVGNNGSFNQFEGLGGNDTITGNGSTRIIFSNATDAVSVNMQAGNASGGLSIGNDTFTGVNSVTGSNLADTYNATGFVGGVGAFNSGDFNIFEGLGGNDTITGNGNTRVAYASAAASVTVDLSSGTAHGTAGGDAAAVGSDTITGGVNSVQGSNFNDFITGGTGNETLFGGGGADTINGGGGSDSIAGQGGNDTIDGGSGTDMAVFTGPQSGYTVTSPSAGVIQVTDNTAARDGADTLTNIEVLQFSDTFMLLTSGTAVNPVDVSGLALYSISGPLVGTGQDDYVAVGNNIYGHHVDLGAGNDTVSLVAPDYYTLDLAGVEHVTGSGGDDFAYLVNNATGLTVDLGAGNDHLNLANGVNSISVSNVENIGGTDYVGSVQNPSNQAPSNDTLTLLNNISGVSVDLGQGINILNLAAGTNSLDQLYNIDQLNGTSSDDSLTITQQSFVKTIDMGGGNDVVNFTSTANFVTVINAEVVNGSANNDFITIGNTIGSTTITGGGGTDSIIASAGADNFRFTVASDSAVGFGDQITNFDAVHDTFTFANMNGPTGFNGATSVHFINGAAFDGSPGTPHYEARVDQLGGNATLQIDVNGDGTFGAGDMEIHLNNYTGTLHDSNFLLS